MHDSQVSAAPPSGAGGQQGPAPGGDPSEAAAHRLTTAAVKGIAWRVGSFGGNRLVIFVSTVILARLLAPSDFGVFAAALAFTQYLEVLLDLGTGSYLVYSQRGGGDDEQVHVAFTFNLAMTVLMAVVAVAAAPLTSAVFGASGHTAVFAVMGAYLLLRGPMQMNKSLMQRDLHFKKMIVLDLSGAVVRAVLSVVLAMNSFGVWAIVIGLMAGQAVSTVAGSVLVRYRPRIRFDWGIGRVMMGFGIKAAAMNILTELALNGDYLIVGSMLGATALGIYTMAYRLPELLINNVFWMFSDVAFPVYSKARIAGTDVLRRAMLKALRLTTLYGFAAGVGLALVSRDAVLTLFGGNWRGAIAPMTVLGLASAVAATGYADGPLFPALGKPGALLVVNIPLTIIRMGGFAFAARYGLVWVAVVHLVTNVSVSLVRFAMANRFIGSTWSQTFGALRPGLAVGLMVTVFALPARILMAPGPGALVTIVVLGAIGAVAGLYLSDRRVFAEIRGLAGSLAARVSAGSQPATDG